MPSIVSFSAFFTQVPPDSHVMPLSQGLNTPHSAPVGFESAERVLAEALARRVVKANESCMIVVKLV